MQRCGIVHRGLELPSFREQGADGLGAAASPCCYVAVGICNKKKRSSIERADLLEKKRVFEGASDRANGERRNIAGDHGEVQ